jgi:pimeloyl-ACP methyl ester carboxylesterase
MRPHTLAVSGAVALLALAVPLATTTVSASPAASPPAAAAAADQPTGLAWYLRQTPIWASCGDRDAPDFECTSVAVPLDYRHPAGATLSVAVSRIRATRPDLRRGILLMNPGGPGDSGLLLPRTFTRNGNLPAAVRERYDLIGFDPRGVGHSSPISCGLTPEQQNYLLLPPESFAADVRRQSTVAAACAHRAGAVLPFLTTRNTARDMDLIRAVLGEPKLSYLGYSYGTYLGSVYTQMFGEHADRVVLDSSVDPRNVWRGLARAVAPAVEHGLDRWAAWTAARDSVYGLGTSGPALRTRFDRLLADGNRSPVPVDDRRLTGEQIRFLAFGVMYDDRLYPVLSDLVRVALLGGHLQPPVHAYIAQALTPPPDDNQVAAQLAVFCDDVSWPHQLAVYARNKARDGRRYPFYGASASTVKPCTFWLYRPLESPTRIGPGNRAPSILMVQADLDTATPAAGAQYLHRLLANSRLLTLQGAQKHIVFAVYGSSCVDATVSAYLAGGPLPQHDATCPPVTSAASKSAAILRGGTR